MSVKSTRWLSGIEGVGPRLIIADLVGDVAASGCEPGDRLLTLSGESYDIVMNGTTLSWGGDAGAGVLAGSVAVVDGTALTAAAAAEVIPAANKIVLPANWWRVGRVLRLILAGRISSVITTPGTARFDIRIGSVVVWDSLAILLDTVAAHVDDPFRLQVDLTCRSIGAAATLIGVGQYASQDLLGVAASAPKGGPVAVLPWATNPAVGAAFDSTVAGAITCFFTQTVATGSVQSTEYWLEALN